MTMAKTRAAASAAIMTATANPNDEAMNVIPNRSITASRQYHPRRRRRSRSPRLLLSACISAALLPSCLLLPLSPRLPTADAFAAWFVDRRVSCLTDLAPGEIIMNSGVIAHTASREPDVRIDVSPLEGKKKKGEGGGGGGGDGASPGSEYVARFVVPPEVRERVSDVQYVIELIGGGGGGGGGGSPVAKFTASPSGGGVGCEGDKRSHGKFSTSDDSFNSAIFALDENAAMGSRLEIVAGWATGHESVTLTKKVAIVVGRGIVRDDDDGGGGATTAGEAAAAAAAEGRRNLQRDDPNDAASTTKEKDDDSLDDDEAEAELEEALIEEERMDLEGEIDAAEADAVEALEEKRREFEEEGEDVPGERINEAEEEIVEALEENRKDVDQALNALKDEIMLGYEERRKENIPQKGKQQHHSVAERMAARKQHLEKHQKKHLEGKLEEMRRRFQNAQDARKDKLEELMDMKDALKNNVERLQKMDKKEHERAMREHLKPLPKEELRVDMEELKRKAREKMAMLSDKLGVNELINDPKMKQIRGELQKGLIRGGGAAYHRDVGTPLPPGYRHFLMVMFALFAGVGLIRWYLDKRRRARKGRRNL